MESNSSELRGEGVPSTPQPTAAQCCYVGPGGRHCRSLAGDVSGLCPHHARLVTGEDPIISDTTAKALLAGVDDFATPGKVKLFLGNLAKQVVRQRVGRRDAITLSYICQLILNSQGAAWRDVREFDRHKQNQPKPPLQITWDIPGPNRSSSEPDQKSDQAANQEGEA